MLRYLLLLFLYSGVETSHKSGEESGSDSDFGGNLVSSLRNDVNLDLSVDEDYEDLRAELLAYHTALASMSSRRSLISTPCWALGGICVNHKLCSGHKYLSEIPGCKNKLNVCCFAWNRYQIRDMKDEGIANAAFPWTLKRDFGGEGIVIHEQKNKGRKFKSVNNTKPVALLLRNKLIVLYFLFSFNHLYVNA